jgi:hypothetical protein
MPITGPGTGNLKYRTSISPINWYTNNRVRAGSTVVPKGEVPFILAKLQAGLRSKINKKQFTDR